MLNNNFQRSDGMNYAPKGIAKKVVDDGEFCFAVVGLDHGHIYGMCNGFIEAGGILDCVYDPDSDKIARFKNVYGDVKTAKSFEEILANPKIQLVVSASIPANRADIAVSSLNAGKHFFGDKPSVVTLEQLQACKKAAMDNNKKYGVYFSERLHVEGAVLAGQLISEGAIGKVIHMDGFGPHRISIPIRPDWFFDKKYYGGILCDLASHQIEQFLYYANVENATIDFAKTSNRNNAQFPNFEDFGELHITADNGATAHIRVDWFTPDSLPVWGDGRTFIVGTKGYIEIRKYINLATDITSDHVFLCNNETCKHIEAKQTVGFPFFGAFILDCINNTENSISQDHVYKTMELAVIAQKLAST